MAWGVPKIGSLATVSSDNISPSEPAGVAQGDLLVACIAYRSNETFTLPSDWSLIATQQSSGDTDAANGIASGVMAYIVRGASAPSLTFTRSGGNLALGRIIAYTPSVGVPTYDTGSANTLASTSTSVTTSSLTTAEANELLVAMTSAGDSHTVSSFDAATDPATASGATDTTNAPTAGTWRERADNTSTSGADGGLGIADAVKATAGSTGQLSAVLSDDSRAVMIVGAFKEVIPQSAPTIALNTTDATDFGSDTTPTLEFTGSDADSDDLRYQVQVNTSNSWGVIDGYGAENQSSSVNVIGDGFNTGQGQSFTGDGSTVLSAEFMLKKVGSPTGNATAKIYAHSGTFGSTGLPTGAALAVSDTFDVSTLTTTLTMVTFTFSGGNQITLTNGENYFLTIEKAVQDASNNVALGKDTTSSTHAGNSAFQQAGSWFGHGGTDFIFSVNSSPPILDKLSGTDAGFLNTVSGGDTDPFNVGQKVSYTVQAGDALANGTYYWRARVIDPFGSVTYSSWATARSFTVSAGAANTTNFFQFF